MTHYYITDPNSEKGFVEVTEAEFTALIGTEETRPYAYKVYRGVISIEDVPENLREDVQAVVNNRIARFGEYKTNEATISDYQDALTEFGVEV